MLNNVFASFYTTQSQEKNFIEVQEILQHDTEDITTWDQRERM